MKCKEKTCIRKAFRVEKNTKGETVIVFQTRHDGKPHIQEFTSSELLELARMLEAK